MVLSRDGQDSIAYTYRQWYIFGLNLAASYPRRVWQTSDYPPTRTHECLVPCVHCQQGVELAPRSELNCRNRGRHRPGETQSSQKSSRQLNRPLATPHRPSCVGRQRAAPMSKQRLSVDTRDTQPLPPWRSRPGMLTQNAIAAWAAACEWSCSAQPSSAECPSTLRWQTICPS